MARLLLARFATVSQGVNESVSTFDMPYNESIIFLRIEQIT